MREPQLFILFTYILTFQFSFAVNQNEKTIFLSLSCLSSFLPEFKEKENDEKETKKPERSGIESISEGENLFPD